MPYLTYAGWHEARNWAGGRLHSQRVVDWLVRPVDYNHLEIVYELLRQYAGGGHGTFDREEVLAKLLVEFPSASPRPTKAADHEGTHWWESPMGRRTNIGAGIAALCEGREGEPAYEKLRQWVLEEGWDRGWEPRMTALEYLQLTEHTNNARAPGAARCLAMEILQRATGPRFTFSTYDDDPVLVIDAADDAVWTPSELLRPHAGATASLGPDAPEAGAGLESKTSMPFQPHLWWLAHAVLAVAEDSFESPNHSRRLVQGTLQVLVEWLQGERSTPLDMNSDFAVRHVLYCLRHVSVPGCGRLLAELLALRHRYINLPSTGKEWQYNINVWEEALQIISRGCKYEVFAGRGSIFSDSERALLSEAAFECLKVTAHPREANTRVIVLEILGFLGDERAVALLQVTNMNAMLVRQTVISLCSILGVKEGTKTLVQRVAKNRTLDLPDPLYEMQHIEALKYVPSRVAMEEVLESLIDDSDEAESSAARMLMSKVGGLSVLKKLESRATSAEGYMAMVQSTEETAQKRFDSALRDARNGFFIGLVMDVAVFIVGLALIITSAALVVMRDGNLESWAGVGVTSGTGLLGVLYTLLVGKPRERVKTGVSELMKLKTAFLGFLRQLQQCDHAFTRRMLDNEGVSPSDLAQYTSLVRTITSTTIGAIDVMPVETATGLSMSSTKIAPEELT